MRLARWFFCLCLAAGALVASPRPGFAQNCSVTTTSISFGIYDVFSTVALASTGSVTVRCFLSPGVAVWLDKGVNAPSNLPRQLASGSNRLSYNLYLDAAHTAVWGDPNPNHADTGMILWWPVTLTVYAQIPAGQDVPAGTYTDTVTVTINF
jgi:spore coat protein U-like protein